MSKRDRNRIGPPSQQTSLTVSATKFSGPLPHPEILARYESILPGAADRIITMAEGEAKHVREMDRLTLEAVRTHVHTGQYLGFSIGVLALATSLAMAVLGYERAAIAIGSTTIIGLVAVFVIGRFKDGQPDSSTTDSPN